jgi:protein-S-isoprenylcysteine O-methyltransferase Ste14
MNWSIPLIAALVLSLAAYSWAIRKFFTIPSDGLPAPMRVLSATALCVLLTHVYLLVAVSPRFLQATAALLTYVVAFSLFAWAAFVTRARPLPIAFSDLAPAQVVRDGPFQFVAHPFYVSYALTWCAGVIATASWIAAAGAVVMCGFYVAAARRETHGLAKGPLAAEYAQYRRRRIGKRPPASV